MLKVRPNTSKKYCDPVQFVLKFDSFVSNRTTDTMGVAFKGGNDFKVGPFEKTPLPSISNIIDGLVKHIELKIEIIQDKRGNLN